MFNSKLVSSALIIFSLVIIVQARTAQSRKHRVKKTPPTPVVKVRFVEGNGLGSKFESANNFILLQATVNNSEPLWFIFDTGAAYSVLDTELAKALSLKSRGKITDSGAAGTAKGLIFEQVSLKLPNLEASYHTIASYPLGFLAPPLGRKIGGVVGNDIIRESVVEIDYDTYVIQFHDPGKYQYSGSEKMVPLKLDDSAAFVRAVVTQEGRPPIGGKFELDSGSTSAILFNTPFVRRQQLLKYVPRKNQINVGGVGGTGRGMVGRIKSLALGDFVLQQPIAQFFQGRRGDNASAGYDGLIGGDVFRRFKVVLDYPHRRMILQPNAQFNEQFDNDMSGLKLIAEGEDFSVISVGNEVEAGTPAAEAGIQGEDIITAIDGHPVKEFTLEQIRKMFMQDGKSFVIGLKRGDSELQTTLKLRRSI
jgi:hypothetical protein